MKLVTVLLIRASCALVSGGPTGSFPRPPVAPLSAIDPFQNVTKPTCTTDDNVIRVQNGMIDQRYRWQVFNVYPDRAYNADERRAINDAMYNLMQVLPCVQFGIYDPDQTPSGDYVHIIKGTGNGCNSYVGRLGIGRQDMNLQSPGCMSIGTVMHEMIHALGFHHEHGSPNRDDHVNILYDNIEPQYVYAFDKFPPSEVSTFNVPYNTRSIMHYGSGAFSRNGQPTIVTKSGGWIDESSQLQDTDIRKLKAMYGC